MNYFKEWLSGFIESEGCFSIRKNGNHSFSISQKEREIIERIKEYLGSSNKVRENKGVYMLEIYKKEVLRRLEEHIKEKRLMGEKRISSERFYKVLCGNSTVV